MRQKQNTPQSPKPRGQGAGAREDRLKSALKANLARRKAQARARADTDETEGGDSQE